MRLILAALLLVGGAQVLAQPSISLDRKFWMTDGPVNTVLVTNGAIYIGGDFSYVGPRTGPAGLFDQATGSFLGAPARINGIVRAVVPDGAGGWFIGGSFTSVGDAPMVHLAHLMPDLSVDRRWNARVQGSAVYALASDGKTLYLGGQLQRVGAKLITGLAGVRIADGEVTWDPRLSGNVYALKLANGLLYAGGSFYSVGDVAAQNLTAIAISNAVAVSWNPAPDQPVLAIEVSGNNVYAGGQFTSIGTKPRNRLAALDASTGVATTWNPNPNGLIRALGLSGNSVYVCGDFTTIGGQNRKGFGAVNTGNGAAQTLDPKLEFPAWAQGPVRCLLVSGDSLYIGGSLSGAMGAVHRLVAGISTSGQEMPTPPGCDFNGASGAQYAVNAIAAAGGQVFVGGDFQSIGGVPRKRAAALSATTGAVLPWAPEVSGPVMALAYGANQIYVGGVFTNLNGQTATSLGAVDTGQGTSNKPFQFEGTTPYGDVTVSALLLTTNRLFVGGSFQEVAGEARKLLAAVDPDAGTLVTGFDAKLGSGYYGVTALLLANNNLYVAGDFSTVGSQAVGRLAALAPNDGALRSWTPNPNQTVTTLAATSDNLYVGGQFTQIAGTAFRNFAVFSLSDHSLMGVDAALPTSSYGVNAIAATPTTLYISGTFDSAGGEFRQNAACLAGFNASAYEWDPAFDTPPSFIALTDELAIFAGTYRFLGRYPNSTPNGFLTVFPRGARISSAVPASGNKLSLVTTTGDRTDAVIETTADLSNPAWTPVATNDVPGYTWTTQVPMAGGPQYFRVVSR